MHHATPDIRCKSYHNMQRRQKYKYYLFITAFVMELTETALEFEWSTKKTDEKKRIGPSTRFYVHNLG